MTEFEQLQAKENWTQADYQRSLELLRDDEIVTDHLRDEIDNEYVYEVLDFNGGWLELAEAWTEEDKKHYQAAFKRL